MTDNLLKEAQDAFKEAADVDADNRRDYLDDIRFGRLGEQWDEDLKQRRIEEGRPVLTINKLPPFIRQVVNDGRQNKPQIKVLPQDSGADPETAEVLSGLIRNIEVSSDADIAYDTALDNAASGGFGYWRVNLAYASDDSWDQDIVIERIANPLSVYGDPYSDKADSSDWNVAFVTTMLSRVAFKRMYPGAAEVDFGAERFPTGWREGDKLMVAEYWKREQVRKQITMLSDGQVIGVEAFEANLAMFQAAGIMPIGQTRDVLSHKVVQHIVNGAEVIDTVEWAGRWIPIVPVYGEEVNVDGKRYFRSLIRDAKDPQVMFNAWRTASTEAVALAPKAPFIGKKGAFNHDIDKWETANTRSWAFIEYDGTEAPERQPFTGVPAGNLQEALNASDDIKSVVGMYDASLGARSNETSGRAIIARQREADVSTFHFIDNLSRAIRHTGRILIDLIPKVYTEDRVIRILGEQNEPRTVQLGTPEEAEQSRMMAQQAESEAVRRIYSLGVGRYDLAVTTGPSFTTRREETANQMMMLIQAYPAAAPVLGDLFAKNLDWPGADEIAKRLEALQQGAGGDPEAAQMIQSLQAELQALAQENDRLKADRALEAEKNQIDAFEAQTDRLKAVADMTRPSQVRQAV